MCHFRKIFQMPKLTWVYTLYNSVQVGFFSLRNLKALSVTVMVKKCLQNALEIKNK